MFAINSEKSRLTKNLKIMKIKAMEMKDMIFVTFIHMSNVLLVCASHHEVFRRDQGDHSTEAMVMRK